MTLLVRDEADIVRQNIEYHLSHGVDFIVATDNRSQDGTLEILQEYERAGSLHLIQEETLDYAQAEWVNRMGRIAREAYAADIIFHCDADEFWVSSSGNLKDEIVRKPPYDCLKVPIYHSQLQDRDGAERFPEDTVCFRVPDRRLLAGNWRDFPSACKVMFKTKRGLPDVDMGNHALMDRHERFSTCVSNEIKVFHFGVRTREHFYRKICNGGSAVESNRALGDQVAIHWRAGYQLYKEGRLDEEYRRNTLTEQELLRRLADGSVIRIDRFGPVFKSPVGNDKDGGLI